MKQGLTHRRILFLISAALVIATLVAYEPIRHNGFVNFDDGLYISKNPNVNKGITCDSVAWAFTKSYASNWHPVTWLSHILDCEIYGLNPTGHHITSVFIHIISSVLLFWVLQRMTGAMWSSTFVAAMFALHPVHVESVAWAAERRDVLIGLFWVLTILSYARYTERPNFRRYSLVLLFFAMGLMSKSMVVTLPLVLLMLDYWPFERLKTRRSVLNSVVEKIPLFALSAISSLITLIMYTGGGAIATLKGISIDGRVANMFVSYMRYIGKTIWPSRLAVFYPHTRPELTDATTVICALSLAVITVLVIHIGRRRKYAAVGWLWYVIMLVPVIGLVQVGAQGLADRYMYLPMIGLLIIAGWAVKDLVGENRGLKIAATVTAGAIVLSCVILTRIQVSYWRNSITLFAHALKVTKNNKLAENNYGAALLDAGQFKEAEPYLKSALVQDPTYSDARNNLGKVYLHEGRLDEAIKCFMEVIKGNRGTAEVYYNLGMALGMQGKYDDATWYFSRGIELNPEYPEIEKRMGTALLATGRPKEAIEHLQKSMRTNPYETVVYISISIAYIKTGSYEEALENWSKAEKLQAESPYMLNNPAWLIVTAGEVSTEDANNAIAFTERACEMTGYKEANLLDTLGAAYAAAGRFEEAATTAQKAINAAKAMGQEEVAERIEKRLELYRAGQRYIQK